MISVYWSNRLERLADELFGRLAGEQAKSPADVLSRRECVVIPNRILQHWLQHRFLYRDDAPAIPRVLANVEFPLLNIFVNDWLFPDFLQGQRFNGCRCLKLFWALASSAACCRRKEQERWLSGRPELSKVPVDVSLTGILLGGTRVRDEYGASETLPG